MNLKPKIIIILLFAFAFFVLAQFITEKVVLLPDYWDLQETAAIKDMQRCKDAISSEVNHVGILASDWATWDDTYRFVNDRNEQFIKSCLPETAFEAANLNLIYFYNTSGQKVWGKVTGLPPENIAEIIAFMEKRVNKQHHVLQNDNIESKVEGLLVTNAGVLIVSSAPIITSEGKGPIRGHLIMGRFVSEDLIANLQDQTSVMFDLNTTNSAYKLYPQLADHTFTKKTFWIDYNKDVINIYSTIKDISGQPLLLIKVDVSPDIITRGKTTAKMFMIQMFLTGSLIVILIYILLHKIILSRLKNMGQTILKITEEKIWTTNILILGNDELNLLANKINEMLVVIYNSEKELEASKNRYYDIATATADCIIEIDASFQITYVSDSIKQLTGDEPKKLINCGIFERVAHDEKQRLTMILSEHLENKTNFKNLEYWSVDINGQNIFLVADGTPIIDKNGDIQGFRGVIRNCMQRKNKEIDLQIKASTDPLTGVFNKGELFIRLKREIENARENFLPLSILMLDIDYFKKVNDTYGHAIGDQILIVFASICLAKLRKSDILARYGGEEFVVILPGAKEKEANLIAEIIRETISTLPIPQSPNKQTISVSIGLATLTDNMDEGNNLLDQADKALYQAKESGRNRVVSYTNLMKELEMSKAD